jgi:hypothetical protein
LLDGFEFYESQQLDLDWYFLDSLYADIDSLGLYAGIHPKPLGGLHWTTGRRFPFSIYYRVADDVTTAVGVLDIRERDIGSYVIDAKKAVAAQGMLWATAFVRKENWLLPRQKVECNKTFSAFIVRTNRSPHAPPSTRVGSRSA